MRYASASLYDDGLGSPAEPPYRFHLEHGDFPLRDRPVVVLCRRQASLGGWRMTRAHLGQLVDEHRPVLSRGCQHTRVQP